MRAREGFETLRRIALLLMALAILAERAGGRGHAVRCRVLFALRPAQAAASAYAQDVALFIPDATLLAPEAAHFAPEPAPLDTETTVHAPEAEHRTPETAHRAPESALLDPDELLAGDFGDDPDDAARMAASFRALAMIFFALASRAPRRARQTVPRHGTSGVRRRRYAVRRAHFCLAARSRAPPAGSRPSWGGSRPPPSASPAQMRFFEAA